MDKQSDNNKRPVVINLQDIPHYDPKMVTKMQEMIRKDRLPVIININDAGKAGPVMDSDVKREASGLIGLGTPVTIRNNTYVDYFIDSDPGKENCRIESGVVVIRGNNTTVWLRSLDKMAKFTTNDRGTANLIAGKCLEIEAYKDVCAVQTPDGTYEVHARREGHYDAVDTDLGVLKETARVINAPTVNRNLER